MAKPKTKAAGRVSRPSTSRAEAKTSAPMVAIRLIGMVILLSGQMAGTASQVFTISE